MAYFSCCILLLSFLVGATLTGCRVKGASTEVFDNYLYRLGNSLQADSYDEQRLTLLPVYPKKSQVAHPIPAMNVNVIQFLQLSKCELQRLVGHRNSSLGKLMSGYHSMLYEREFKVLAQQCREQYEEGSASYRLLGSAIEYKNKYEKKLYWNGVFADKDIKQLFSVASQPLTLKQIESPPSELIVALETILHWLDSPTMDDTNLKQAFEVVSNGKYIGQLRLTMNMAVHRLAQADHLIHARLQERPLCYQEQTSPQFEIVFNVFHLFYIGEVQPLLAKIDQQASTLLKLIDNIQSTLESTEGFEQYWQQIYLGDESEWHRFRHAVAIHTDYWQRLLKQCGRLPGKRS